MRIRLDPFVVALLAAALVGSLFPVTGSAYEVLRTIAMISIGVLFFLYGLRLSTSETLHGLRNWRLHTAILATTFAVFPLAGLALQRLVDEPLGPSLAAGVLLLCLIPTTVQSNIVYTRMAGGDVAGAVVAASLSNLIGVFLTPALVAVFMSAHARVDGHAVGRIVLQLLAPFVLGQLLRRWLKHWVTRNDGWLRHVDRSSIVLVVFVAFCAGAHAHVWSRTSIGAVLGLLLACVLLLAAAAAWTTGLGRIVGLDRPARIALLFCGTNKSLATGLPMATVLFGGERVALIVLPLMIYHQLQILAGGVIAGRLARADRA